MTKAFKYIRILPQNSVFEDFKILRGKQLNIYVPKKKKKELRYIPLSFTKINSMWIIELDVIYKTVKFLGGKIVENLYDLGMVMTSPPSNILFI